MVNSNTITNLSECDNFFTALGEYILQSMAHLPEGERNKRIEFLLDYLPLAMQNYGTKEAHIQAYQDWLRAED